MQGGMTKCVEERWTPPLQPGRAILARAHLLNGSPPTSSSFTLTSNSPPLCLHASPWPWRNDRPFNYLHRLIAADCNCRELFRLCWNCSLNGREAERARYTRSNKLPTWSIGLFQKQQLWKPNCADQWSRAGKQHQAVACTVVTELPAQHQISTVPLLWYVK